MHPKYYSQVTVYEKKFRMQFISHLYEETITLILFHVLLSYDGEEECEDVNIHRYSRLLTMAMKPWKPHPARAFLTE